MGDLEINEEEKEWMADNVGYIPGNWTQRQLELPTKNHLMECYVKHQNNLTETRRRDLRILHGGRMRKIQEAADEGKIGAILKEITGDKSPFSLDCIKVGESQVTDKTDITKIITKLFRDWFFRSEEDA